MTLTALPPMDVASRLPRLRDSLAAAGCEAVLVTNLKNIRYLTGFTGSAALLLDARPLVEAHRQEQVDGGPPQPKHRPD